MTNIFGIFQSYFPSFFFTCTAGLLKLGHISLSWEVLFHMSDQADTVKAGVMVQSLHPHPYQSASRSRSCHKAERSLQNNSSEEINCCRNHAVHQGSPSGCLGGPRAVATPIHFLLPIRCNPLKEWRLQALLLLPLQTLISRKVIC